MLTFATIHFYFCYNYSDCMKVLVVVVDFVVYIVNVILVPLLVVHSNNIQFWTEASKG